MEFVATVRLYLLSCKVNQVVVLHLSSLVESFRSLHSDIPCSSVLVTDKPFVCQMQLSVSLSLITFMPDSPSTTHPCISVPCTRTLMAGLRWSMIVGPRLVSVNRAGMVMCGVCSHASIACRNRVTKLKSLLIVSVIGQSGRASQIGSASVLLLTSGVLEADSYRIRSMLRWLLSPIPELLFLCHLVPPIPSFFPCSVSLLVVHQPF